MTSSIPAPSVYLVLRKGSRIFSAHGVRITGCLQWVDVSDVVRQSVTVRLEAGGATRPLR